MNTPAELKNPLLDFSGLPRFAEVRPEHVTPAVNHLLQHNRDVVARLLADTSQPTWESFVLPLDDANEQMSRAWGQVGHLNAVMNSAELREVYNANLPKITQYYAELGQNLALYAKFKALLWTEVNDLPENTIPYIRRAIENFQTGVMFEEFGWEQ